jgi:hypothetical protein
MDPVARPPPIYYIDIYKREELKLLFPWYVIHRRERLCKVER